MVTHHNNSKVETLAQVDLPRKVVLQQAVLIIHLTRKDILHLLALEWVQIIVHRILHINIPIRADRGHQVVRHLLEVPDLVVIHYLHHRHNSNMVHHKVRDMRLVRPLNHHNQLNRRTSSLVGRVNHQHLIIRTLILGILVDKIAMIVQVVGELDWVPHPVHLIHKL